MTPPDIAALRALLDKATTLPWTCTSTGDDELYIAPGVISGCGCCGSPYTNNAVNPHLIVAAVNALPALLDRLERAERRVEAIVALVREAYNEGWDTGTWDEADGDALNTETREADWKVSKVRAAIDTALTPTPEQP